MTRIRRILTAVATLAGALLAFTAASPAAFAVRVPPPSDRPDRRRGRPGRRRHSRARGPRLGSAQGTRHHRLNPRLRLAGPQTGKVRCAARPPLPGTDQLAASRHHAAARERSRRDQLAPCHSPGRARLQAAQPQCRTGSSGRHHRAGTNQISPRGIGDLAA
jgi:hypothetical protein